MRLQRVLTATDVVRPTGRSYLARYDVPFAQRGGTEKRMP